MPEPYVRENHMAYVRMFCAEMTVYMVLENPSLSVMTDSASYHGFLTLGPCPDPPQRLF